MLTKSEALEPFKKAQREKMRLGFQESIDACLFRDRAKHISEMRELYRSHGLYYGHRERCLMHAVPVESKDDPDYSGQVCVHGVHVRSECPDCQEETGFSNDEKGWVG